MPNCSRVRPPPSFASIIIDISARLDYQHLDSSPSNGPNHTQHLYDRRGPKLTQTLYHPLPRLQSSASNSPARDAAPLASNRPSGYRAESGCRHLNYLYKLTSHTACANLAQVLARPDSTCLCSYVDTRFLPPFLPRDNPLH